MRPFWYVFSRASSPYSVLYRQWLPVLALCLIAPAVAQADLRIVGPAVTPAGKLVRLQAQGDLDGAALIWDVNDEEKADVAELGKRLIFTGPAGKYRVKLRAIRIMDGVPSVETARHLVTIGEAPPVPPGPGPDPKPPTPPVPPPPDPLTLKIQAAYMADAGTPQEKEKWLAMLSALYGAGAQAVLDPGIKTAGDFLEIQRAAFGRELPADALAGVRKLAQGELVAVLPTDAATPLADATRKAAAEVFSRLAKATGEVK